MSDWFSEGRTYPNGHYDERYHGMVIFGREGSYGWGTGITASPSRFATIEEARQAVDASIARSTPPTTSPDHALASPLDQDLRT